MVRVGTEEHHIILAGCQIHYSVSCPERPNQEDTLQKWADDKEKTLRDNCIYIPEPPAQKDVEIIDGKEVEWLTDKEKLYKELAEKESYYFETIKHRQNLANYIETKLKRYRIYRKPYSSTLTIDIEFTDGSSVILGNL